MSENQYYQKRFDELRERVDVAIAYVWDVFFMVMRKVMYCRLRYAQVVWYFFEFLAPLRLWEEVIKPELKRLSQSEFAARIDDSEDAGQRRIHIWLTEGLI